VRYAEQRQFLSFSSVYGAAAVASLLALAAVCLLLAGPLPPLAAIAFVSATVALAASIYYTPDYLHLTVNPEKRRRWEVKIRWRVIGAVVLFGLLSVSSAAGVLLLLGATGWLIAANMLAGRLTGRYCAPYCWATDLALLAALLFSGKLSLLIGGVLLAGAAHLSIVIEERLPLGWAAAVAGSGCLLLLLPDLARGMGETRSALAAAGLLLVSALATVPGPPRATAQCKKRRRGPAGAGGIHRVRTGAHPASLGDQQSGAGQELGAGGRGGHRCRRPGGWYRENSQLYLFAISAYNLEYKHICSNLKVLRLARGACLDYGAGNGEIVLELARRGHPATYYDVAGETMRFARQRASQQGLEIEFLHSKEDLAASARKRGFDTVFSLDVLEHLPDLPGELNFLSSLLSPGGLFVFDVPAGSTQSHPMH
jgi:hypothetical protein